MLNNKKIVILGGGTNTYISNHLALSAPAYGTTAKKVRSADKAKTILKALKIED